MGDRAGMRVVRCVAEPAEGSAMLLEPRGHDMGLSDCACAVRQFKWLIVPKIVPNPGASKLGKVKRATASGLPAWPGCTG